MNPGRSAKPNPAVEREARIYHVLVRYVKEKPTMAKYRAYPALETIATQEGWDSGGHFSDVCNRNLGKRPTALWRECLEAGSLDPIFNNPTGAGR